MHNLSNRGPVAGATATLFLGLLFSATALAQYPDVSIPSDIDQRGQHDAAIVFAVGDYAFLPPIDGVSETARAWEAFFEDGLGIPDTRVFVRRDRQVTREKMLKFAAEAAKSVEEDGRLWVVFVGHGAPSPSGSGLLLGMDTQPDVESVKARGISRDKLAEAIRAETPNEVIWVLDACFSGKTRTGESLTNAQPLVPTDVADVAPDSAMTVLAAADSTEYAGPLPGANRPAFSYVVLGALRGWADDGDGTLRASEVADFARKHLRHLSHSQTPVLQGRDSVLVSGSSEKDPGLADLLQNDGKAPPKRDAADVRRPEDQPSVPVPEVREAGPWLSDVMDAVCSGQVTIEGDSIRCDFCPTGASAEDGELVVEKAYVGSFSGPDAEEMILATTGCGTGFGFRNSTVLVRKTRGDWRKVEYKDTFFVDDCEPVAAGARAMLVCKHTHGGQGAFNTSINVVSATAGGGFAWYEAAEMFDGTGGCYYTPDESLNGAFKHDIKEMVVDDLDADGHHELAILYTEHIAEPKGDVPFDERCDKSRYNITSTKKAKVLELGSGQYRENPGGLKDVDDSRVKEFLK